MGVCGSAGPELLRPEFVVSLQMIIFVVWFDNPGIDNPRQMWGILR